jgi:hypothetical protein
MSPRIPTSGKVKWFASGFRQVVRLHSLPND